MLKSKIGLIVLLFSGLCFGRQSYLVRCDVGGTTVATAGLSSTNKVEGSFPGCSVTVNIQGGGLATIFSDNIGTSLSNPFTTSTQTGYGIFYADNGRYSVTLSGAGIIVPVVISDVLLNDPASPLGCSSVPALTGDVTSAGGTCATVLPNISTAGTGLKTTINAKGQVTGVATAASTDLSDTTIIARLNAPANFGANAVSGGAISGTTGTFSGAVTAPSATISGEIAPDVTGRALGDTSHRWDLFARNLDISGTVAGITNTGNETISGTLTAASGTFSPTSNGIDVLAASRFTDTTPTGNFINFKSLSGSSVFVVDITGQISKVNGIVFSNNSPSVPSFTNPFIEGSGGGSGYPYAESGNALYFSRQSGAGRDHVFLSENPTIPVWKISRLGNLVGAGSAFNGWVPSTDLSVAADTGTTRHAAGVICFDANEADDCAGTAKMAAIQGPGLHSQIFNSSGTFTIPSGITQLYVTLEGCGGAGGGGSIANGSGSGGGSGGWSDKTLTGLTPANTITVTVCSAATGVNGANGNNGGTSSISSGTQTITTVTANGGLGGGGLGNVPGAGAPVGTNGDDNYGGNVGGIFFSASISGPGAASIFGGAPPGVGTGNGANATAPGAGGSGGSNNATTTGGSGGAGQVKFQWVN